MALFLPKLVLPLLLLLLILSLSVVVLSDSQASDSNPNPNPKKNPTYRCGSFKFSYPFSLYNSESEATTVCGYPDLTVLCDNGITPILPLGSSNLSIRSFDFNRSIIGLVNPVSLASYCPTISRGVALPAGSILNKTTYDVDLTFLYGCNGGLPASFSPIECLTRSYIFVGTSLPPGYNYDQICNEIVKTIAIVPASALQSINVTFSVALQGGFELTWKWNSTECHQCEQSGGWCSYMQSDNSFFTCFNSSKDCRTHFPPSFISSFIYSQFACLVQILAVPTTMAKPEKYVAKIWPVIVTAKLLLNYCFPEQSII